MLPHATSDVERRRSSSQQPPSKFPDFTDPFPSSFDGEQEQRHGQGGEDVFESGGEDISRGPSPRPLPNGLPPGLHSSERWPTRRDSTAKSWASWASNGRLRDTRPGRQKSLSEAIRTVRRRKASMSENAQEIAQALKAPVSMRLVLLCAFWYGTSILTNTSSKAILTALPKPVTLTVIQFLLVSFWCVFLSYLAKRHAGVRDALPVLKNGIRRPSKDIILATLPLTAFQIGGHILNSDAMSRIPVSLVHTIKGLSPLMTVVAYRLFYNIKYSTPTYLSLVPLTLGVIMACSTSFRGNFIGLIYALGSAILFVTQNIVSKTIFNESSQAEADGVPMGRRKPDKLNLLCYSSIMAFLLTCPVWLWSEGFPLLADFFHDGSIDLREKPGSFDHGRLAAEFIFNGTFHFAQSLVAFVLLGMVSPVTYSVASLIKRVVVIMFAIIWWGASMTRIQGLGFLLTFAGLYLYDRTSDSAKADKRAREQGTGESARPLLPMSSTDGTNKKSDGPQSTPSSSSSSGEGGFMGRSGYALGDPMGSGPGRPPLLDGGNVTISLPPGTKAEATWSLGDVVGRQQGRGMG
ncbi:related to glucose-6-phosphate/phosphate and phosphoenolpyruvate/phosphate antiporter [Ramularia collo-cygni]|uniref:Related to glucose-6-phosphate/phosphate and phosphoenolpyruvate/phosphate antiporter n=1 Tax=Ramularia collo-cygni TaxID=112498 RepID=A0A2D3V779_9PEZI|nr:related to glucose-6-phosphate/phosphate and phosphoenolpyruvate/phosphate antiporter [Ramularia collo-cygni]CZT23843.1 related to glucose-6-phosphate/phosphate and phosphoenolpyruvate/phosphate antiporter [Ramularia collo-cygni]